MKYTFFKIVKEIPRALASQPFSGSPLMAVRVTEDSVLILDRVLVWNKTPYGPGYTWNTLDNKLIIKPHWEEVPLEAFLTSRHSRVRAVAKKAFEVGFDSVFLPLEF